MVSFFCFHALGDTKQKKLTPLDRGPPLHVNRPLLFVVNARNNLKSLEVSSDSDLSEVEPFITQTKAALMAVLQLSFGICYVTICVKY